METPRRRARTPIFPYSKGVRRLSHIALATTLTLVGCSASDAAPTPQIEPAPTGTTPSPPSPTPTGTTPSPTPPAPLTCSGKTGARGDRAYDVKTGSRSTSVLVHVPASYDPTKPTQLVVAFHGYLMGSGELRSTTHLADAGDAKSFITAFPQGAGKSWNGGDCCGDASNGDLDDELLAREIVKLLSSEYCVDPKRVFATGFSNGGFLSHRLACHASDVFAAIASVSGVMGIDPSTCTPKRAVPVLQIHGTSDNVVPYKGGRALFVGPEYRSVATTMTAWRDKDACPATPTTTAAPKDKVTCQSWGPCTQGAAVELCTIDGGDHKWPGGSGSNGSSSTWKATDAIVEFFAAHPMP